MLMKNTLGGWRCNCYEEAVQDSKRVFDEARALGFKLNILNVGGGFQHSNFENLRTSIAQYFRTI